MFRHLPLLIHCHRRFCSLIFTRGSVNPLLPYVATQLVNYPVIFSSSPPLRASVLSEALFYFDPFHFKYFDLDHLNAARIKRSCVTCVCARACTPKEIF